METKANMPLQVMRKAVECGAAGAAGTATYSEICVKCLYLCMNIHTPVEPNRNISATGLHTYYKYVLEKHIYVLMT